MRLDAAKLTRVDDALGALAQRLVRLETRVRALDGRRDAAEFDESKHPRVEDGRFGEKAGARKINFSRPPSNLKGHDYQNAVGLLSNLKARKSEEAQKAYLEDRVKVLQDKPELRAYAEKLLANFGEGAAPENPEVSSGVDNHIEFRVGNEKATIKPGSTVYHTTDADFTQFADRPTWFTPFKSEAKGYHSQFSEERSGTRTMKCRWVGGKIATTDEVKQYAKRVWPDSPLIYSMFDERVGEYKPEEVREFIGLLKNAGFDGAVIQDYSSRDSNKDADTLAVFDPKKSIEVEDRKTRMDSAEFHEEDHPRAEDGRFGEKAGAKASHTKATKVDGKHAAPDGGPLPPHVQALKLPPAWTDVTYSEDPEVPLQATGKDSKGREQRVYSKAFSSAQAEAKFARINELQQKYGYILRQNEAARHDPDVKKAAAADCLALIMHMGLRPGSDEDTGAKVQAYGATTLRAEHVVKEGGEVRLKFTGKKGVKLDLPVTDKHLADMLLKRKASAGEDGRLFPISDKQLLDHTHSLDGGGFKTKDFRTLLGTRTAMEEVKKASRPTDPKSYQKAVMQVAKVVSSRLGNTPTVALQSYISPTVFADWRDVA